MRMQGVCWWRWDVWDGLSLKWWRWDWKRGWESDGEGLMYSTHNQGFPGGSEVKASAHNAGDLGSIPGLGISPGEGNGNPLQYSCLENPMDARAWWTTVHRVTKSQTQLSDFTFHSTHKWALYPTGEGTLEVLRSYEIKLSFESSQSDSQESSVWKGSAGRRLLQEAKQEIMLAEAVEMEKRRQSEFWSLCG